MLTISQPLTATMAVDYYENEYAADQGRKPEREAENIGGEWTGKLAESWGLKGAVGVEQFARLCEGLHPLTGERLVGRAAPKTYTNFYGKEVTSIARRAAYDATFSAPKSVSLAALVGGDARVALAHRDAVATAFGVLEEHAQARMGGNRPAQETGRLIAAGFEHAFARPDRAAGYAAPQLHTHRVVLNVTETAEGRAKPLQPLELYRSQRLATAVYRSALAHRLRGLGYEIEVDARTGAPEIKGFSEEYLKANSPRRGEVVRGADEIAARLARGGAEVRRGAGLLHAAAHSARAGKDFDPALMRERHLETDARFGHQARAAVEKALARGHALLTEEDVDGRARELLAATRDEVAARGARVDARQLMSDALRRGYAATTWAAVLREFEASRAAGDLEGVLRERESNGVRHRLGAELRTDDVRSPAAREATCPVPATNSNGRIAADEFVDAPRTVPGESASQTVGRGGGDDTRPRRPGQALREAVARGSVVEVADKVERLRAIVAAYCERPEGALVVSPSAEARARLNQLIRRELQARGSVGHGGRVTEVLIEREEVSGLERAKASSYEAGRDVVRYGRGSKVYGVRPGDYGRVTATDPDGNRVTVRLDGGRELTYDPARLSGVKVYERAEREFAEGDRVRFGSPFGARRVAGGQLGTVTKIETGRITLKLDGGRGVSFDVCEFPHLDYGYAAAACRPAGAPASRVIFDLEAEKTSAQSLRRSGFEALAARGADAALIFTDSADALRAAGGRCVGGRAADEAVTKEAAATIAQAGDIISEREGRGDRQAGAGQKSVIETMNARDLEISLW